MARERKIPIEHALRGKSFGWDGFEGDFLLPEIVPEEAAPSAKNNDSQVRRLRYGSQTLLLPGAARKRGGTRKFFRERERSAEEMHSDVLKIGNHGSKNSTTPAFLAAVRPRFGIISAGEEHPYGHPSPELLERLENAGIRIFRTGRDGAVHVLTDGARWEITCFVACPGATNVPASVRAEAPDHQQDQEKE